MELAVVAYEAEHVIVLVDMREGQHREHRVAGLEVGKTITERIERVRDEIVMREHHAFRRPRRPRRVDQDRKIVDIDAGRERRDARRSGGRRSRAGGFEARQRIVSSAIEMDEARCVGTRRTDARDIFGRLDEDELRIGVFENIIELIESERRERRNDDATGKEDAELRSDPIGAVVGDERDAFARSNAGVAERTGDRARAFEHPRRRGVAPFRGAPPLAER